MAGRKSSQKVDITFKDGEIITLLLKAKDKDTIYLNGEWKHVERSGEDIYEFLPEVLGNKRSGSFTRKNGSSTLTLDAIIDLTGVDTMHGLAHGGKGIAIVRKLGRQQWMAY
jgi:hypothetical protein